VRGEARYTTQATGSGLRQIEARGERFQVTQVLLDGIRSVPGPWGVVLVELGPQPREWVARSLPRARVLEGLLSLRDLLAAGTMDVAVFSSERGIEIFLDRRGELEIRTGAWWEPRFRGLLEKHGFRAAGGQFPAAGSSPARRERSADPARVARVCGYLGLESAPEGRAAAGGRPPSA
jgi:hypothetical protein